MCGGAQLDRVCSFLTPYRFKDQTPFSGVSSKFLYLLSYFADPVLEIFTKIVFYSFTQIVLKVHKTTFRYNMSEKTQKNSTKLFYF